MTTENTGDGDLFDDFQFDDVPHAGSDPATATVQAPEPEPEAAATPAEPAAPEPDRTAALEAEVARIRDAETQRQRDADEFARRFGSNQNQPAPQQQGPDPGELLRMQVNDPVRYQQLTAQAVREEMRQERAVERFQEHANQEVEKFFTSNPDLKAYENYLAVEVQEAQALAAKEGKELSVPDALSAAKNSFLAKIPGAAQSAATPAVAPTGRPQEVTRLDVSGNSAPASAGPVDWTNAPRDQFDAKLAQVMQQRYL